MKMKINLKLKGPWKNVQSSKKSIKMLKKNISIILITLRIKHHTQLSINNSSIIN